MNITNREGDLMKLPDRESILQINLSLTIVWEEKDCGPFFKTENEFLVIFSDFNAWYHDFQQHKHLRIGGNRRRCS
jgi:hypothetical protein